MGLIEASCCKINSLKLSSKKIIFLLAVVFVFSLAACDLDLLKPTLRVPYTTSIRFDIDSSDFKSDIFLLHEETVKMDIDSLIRHYGGNPDQISGSAIRSVTLVLVEPVESNLSFLESSHVSISSESLEETIIARSSDTLASETSLTYELNPAATEMPEIIQAGEECTVYIYGKLNPPLAIRKFDFVLEIEWVFSVIPF
jgi:hypothetical protein